MKGPPWRRARWLRRGVPAAAGLVLAGAAVAAPAPDPGPRPDPSTAGATPSAAARVQAAVVALHAQVAPERPSAATLGQARAGTATLIAPDGLAVTVGYLVLEATRVEVTLADGRRRAARVLGHDFESGLALLQLDPAAGPYPAARLGRSGALAPGQAVAVVGATDTAPVGLAARLTRIGLFVAYWEYLLERALFIAPHHPSFGGAALVDPDGALVGVVSLRLPEGHVAIPIDLLLPVRDALIGQGRPGRPARPWLGIRAVGVGGGVGVAGVSPGGPAHAAGLRPGDVILRVNGDRVGDVEAFYRRLWAEPVARPLEFSVARDGGLETVTVRPADRYAVFEFRTP
jgi:S1-C subfamily serine protease